MPGYTTIEINGQTVGLRFGLHAIQRLGEKLLAMKDMDVTDRNIYFIKQVLYSGYINDCQAKDLIPELKVEDFHEFIEASAVAHTMQGIQDAMKVYSESVYVKAVEVKEEQPPMLINEKKNKKSIGKKSSSSALENA